MEAKPIEVLVPVRATIISFVSRDAPVVGWSGQVDTGLGPPALRKFSVSFPEPRMRGEATLQYWNYGVGRDGLVHADVVFQRQNGRVLQAQSPSARDPSIITFVLLGQETETATISPSSGDEQAFVEHDGQEMKVSISLHSPTPIHTWSIYLEDGSNPPPLAQLPMTVVEGAICVVSQDLVFHADPTHQFHVALQGFLQSGAGFSIFYRFAGRPESVVFRLA